MPTNILDDARSYLVDFLKGKQNVFETKHPWRKGWEFAVLHSLHVEAYVLRILGREDDRLSESEVTLLRLAAILHDIARLEKREDHARAGAEIAAEWLERNGQYGLNAEESRKVLEMIADHSKKEVCEQDFSKGVLKDADTLDEIGVMSIFMTSNWLEHQSPFFFHALRQRLIEVELPFCDQKLSILNTEGAKKILREKRDFVEDFLAQLRDELQAEREAEQSLMRLSQEVESEYSG